MLQKEYKEFLKNAFTGDVTHELFTGISLSNLEDYNVYKSGVYGFLISKYGEPDDEKFLINFIGYEGRPGLLYESLEALCESWIFLGHGPVLKGDYYYNS